MNADRPPRGALPAVLHGLRAWRRRRLRERAGVTGERWAAAVNALPLLDGLDAKELADLQDLTAAFLSRKTIDGAQGFAVDERVRLLIALPACLPILGLDLDWYAGWHEVVVYPGEFLARHEYMDRSGVQHEVERPLSGEAWPRGPIILSWADLEADAAGETAGSVVIHECAHKIDLLDGDANGRPPLHRGMDRRRWSRVWSAAFRRLRQDLAGGRDTPLDEYAAEDPGEFFAVTSEAFFVEPLALKEWDAALYGQLVELYRQDPADRFQRLAETSPAKAKSASA